MGNTVNYKIGEVQSLRRFPDNYQSMSREEKTICDNDWLYAISMPNIKHKCIFYYAEIIFDDSEYQPKINQSKLTKDFIRKAKKTHGDKYDYSSVKYIRSKEKVGITCPKHGVFLQRPDNHLSGNNCPKCKTRTLKHPTQKIVEVETLEVINKVRVKSRKPTNHDVVFSDDFMSFLNEI